MSAHPPSALRYGAHLPRASLVALPLALVLALTLPPSTGVAHVAPSVDENNRYLKITPLADRIRIAYTVYFGELPGAEARRRIDRNGDGTIDDAEAQAHGAEIAAEVAPGLQLTVDGVATPVVWAEVHVGLGMPITNAGSYAVDLIAWLCLPAAASHTLVVRDGLILPRAGERELKVEPGPGIEIERAGTGDLPIELDLRLRGNGGALADPGYTLRYRSAAGALAHPGDERGCPTAGQPKPGDGPGTSRPRWPMVLGVLAVVAAAAGTLRWRRRAASAQAQKTQG